MRALVTGGSGFIGLRLLTKLRGARVLSRDVRRARGIIGGDSDVLPWDGRGPLPDGALDGIDVVFHLAGESVSRRWTAARKAELRASRIDSTRSLVEAMRRAPPRVFVCASASGFYGDRGDELLDESAPPGNDFLAELCRDWEATAAEAGALGVRVVHPRFGVVLELGGGALAKMLTPFRLGVGGRLGSGKQWMSWVHLDDAVGLLLHAAARDTARGPMNAAAPEPVRNADFTRSLARALSRPAFLPAPAMALRLALGEMAEILLASQRLVPRVARETGYSFEYTELDAALSHVFAPTGE